MDEHEEKSRTERESGADPRGREGKRKPTSGAPEGGLGSVIGGRPTGDDVVVGHGTTGDWGGEGRAPSGRGVRMRGDDPTVAERGAGAGKEADLHAFTDDDEEPSGG